MFVISLAALALQATPSALPAPSTVPVGSSVLRSTMDDSPPSQERTGLASAPIALAPPPEAAADIPAPAAILGQGSATVASGVGMQQIQPVGETPRPRDETRRPSRRPD